MKTLLALIVVIAIGAGIYWYYNSGGRGTLEQAETRTAERAREAGDALRDTFKDLNVDEIKSELEKTGRVVRKKAQQVGAAVADATADTRITTAIKAKLVKDPHLSALRISVSTTDGVVTLSGSADSAEEISEAVKLALDTEGVREAISTIQIKASR
jgi:hyperosmotically inducible periplasmic protein